MTGCGNVYRSYAEWFSSPPADVAGWLGKDAAAGISAVLDAQAEHVAGSLAEIGVYQGRTFIGLAFAAEPSERVVGVDLFQSSGMTYRDIFAANVGRYVPPHRRGRLYVEHRASGEILATHWQEILRGPARFVHIDGGHTRKQVLYDLSLAMSALHRDGVIVFDDFCNHRFPGVTVGIADGLRAYPHLQPIAAINSYEGYCSKLICVIRGCKIDYGAALTRGLSGCDSARTSFIDDDITVWLRDPPTPQTSD